MTYPVPRLASEFRSLVNQYNRPVRLVLEEDHKYTSSEPHEGGYISRPSPPKVRLSDKAADHRPGKWATDDGCRERCNSNAAYFVTVHVREHSCHDRQWAGAEKAGEEPRDHERLVILDRRVELAPVSYGAIVDGVRTLCDGYGYVEDAEAGGGEDNGHTSTVQFGHGGEDDWSKSIA